MALAAAAAALAVLAAAAQAQWQPCTLPPSAGVFLAR